MFQIVETLQKYWLRHGIKLNDGASENALAAFEAMHEVRLPEDLREYFASVNGFDDTVDDNDVTFLRLEDMKPLSEYWSSDVADAESYFVFADYSISAHVYAIRLLNSPRNGNPVVVVYDREPVEVANSFSEFIEGYLENSVGVLFPDPPA